MCICGLYADLATFVLGMTTTVNVEQLLELWIRSGLAICAARCPLQTVIESNAGSPV